MIGAMPHQRARFFAQTTLNLRKHEALLSVGVYTYLGIVQKRHSCESEWQLETVP
jgi:hypothetical protein